MSERSERRPDQSMIGARELAGVLGLPPPTAEQAAVIEAPLAPSVVVAGAGSGKTETMAARVVWLVANRLVPPAGVLGLTFTRKAAAELGRRLRRRLAQWRRVVERDRPDDAEHLAELLAGEPTVLTYSAYAARLVAEHAMRVGAEPGARLLSQAVCWQLADSVVRRYPERLPADIGALVSVTRYVLALAGDLADHLVTSGEVERFCSTALATWAALPNGPKTRTDTPGKTSDLVDALEHRRALTDLVERFADAKRALSAVDFGDQLALAAQLAEVADVVRVERERYPAVLLDEYQDTGHAQVRLLAGLFGPVSLGPPSEDAGPAAPGLTVDAGHPVTAVGDPFQSIYGWRGASAGNIGRFAITFPAMDGRGATRFPLATSWRNDAAVLDAANTVAAPLRARDASTVQLRARADAGPGALRAVVTDTVEAEAAWVAERLRGQWDARPAGARTAAVLVRRRSQLPLLAETIRDAGLPVEVVGLGGLLTTPEVIDVVATLRVLADHKSGPALARLLTGARWRIGARDLAALSGRAGWLARQRRTDDADAADDVDQGSLVEALDDLGPPDAYSAEGHRRLAALAGELRGLRRRLSAPLPELVADVERSLGVDVEVAARPDRVHVGRIHLDRFLDEAARFAADADQATLPAFLAFCEAAEDEENGLEAGEVTVAAERVQLLTVHGAKGLEWDVVAIPGLVDGVFPAAPRSVDWTRTRQLLPAPLRGDAADLPTFTLDGAADRKEVADRLAAHTAEVRERHQYEERRLAYVALTRARSTLLLSGYVWDDAKRPHDVSPFLVELRELADVDGWFVAEPGGENPRLAQVPSATWPADPLGPRRADVEAGAALVRAALRDGPSDATERPAAAPLPGLLDDPASRHAAWRRDVDLLLAERAELDRSGPIEVPLPARLSVSQLVTLRRNPDELARRLRRPLPARPAPLARRGTSFHAWLEQRWLAQPLLDVDELPGAADESANPADDHELAALRDAFERSAWAARAPAEVEVPFEMALGDPAGTVIRGRMDAVFRDQDGYTVVDWKTGARPRGAEAEAAAVQLAAYRLAWSRLAGVPLDTVRAAFHYVRTDDTVAPVNLLDADGLRGLITGSAG